jgi:hypothetical protein
MMIISRPFHCPALQHSTHCRYKIAVMLSPTIAGVTTICTVAERVYAAHLLKRGKFVYWEWPTQVIFCGQSKWIKLHNIRVSLCDDSCNTPVFSYCHLSQISIVCDWCRSHTRFTFGLSKQDVFNPLLRNLCTCWKVLDDDHVDGVRLRLWTAVTNGLIVHSPGDI